MSQGEVIYALSVELAGDNTTPTKTSISKHESHTQEKQEAINLRVLSETMLLLK